MNDTAFPSDSFDEDSMVTMRPGSGPSLGRVDQYELVRKLGGGGFGVVYLARDTNGGVEVAVKTLHPLLKHSPEEMEALRAKFALVSRLAHPNVATALVLHPVRDVSIPDETARRELKLSPGDSVMVMRYAPGVTLSKWRRQFPDGVVPPELALEIGRQIASALDYAHSEKIVHRDVKPGNVMVETLAAEPPQAVDHGHGGALPPGAPKIRVRILDFGLAAEIRSSMSRISTEQGDTSGTRPYMAPEQWLGRKQDGRTDQYALACVLYELLSGAPPFSGVFETGDPMIMKSAVVDDPPEELESLPPPANAALLRALAKAPKDRFPTCGAFVEALEGRDGSTSRPPDGRAVGASLPETAVGAGSPSAPDRQSAGGTPAPPGAPQERSAVEDEAALLLRKATLQDALAAIPDADRADKEFGPIVNEATHAFTAAEEALKFGRIPAFAACLDRVDAALVRLHEARLAREEEKRRQEMARRQQEEERRRREEEERLRREQEERRRREEERRRRKEEEERRRREEEERRLREEEENRAREQVISSFLENMVPIPGRNYRMSKYEVTQAQWKVVMGDNPSHFQSGGDYPVECVSWNDCQVFLEKLNLLPVVRNSGLVFRLPTEQEWEYVCRAEATGPYCRLADGTEITKESLDRVAWFADNSGAKTHPVGQKEPNAFGLCDMHGNVWEWTQTADGEIRVSRGGSWYSSARRCVSSFRLGNSPGFRNFILGFRLCASGRAD